MFQLFSISFARALYALLTLFRRFSGSDKSDLYRRRDSGWIDAFRPNDCDLVDLPMRLRAPRSNQRDCYLSNLMCLVNACRIVYCPFHPPQYALGLQLRAVSI